MPDWKAPFHLPRLTPEEYAKRKAAYVKKHGYTVTYPGTEDFIRIEITKPITNEEQIHWVDKDFGFFSKERLEEIQVFKRRRKEQFLKMLASPTPAIFNARSSYIAAIDDTQDAISTLAAIGKLAVRRLSIPIASLIAGPVGWLMRTADLLNIATTVVTPERPKRISKRQMDSLTSLNPKSRKIIWRRTQNMSTQGFHGGDAIQAAQVSGDVYGVGISLGAFMAFPVDFLSGVVRGVAGQPVDFKLQALDIPFWHIVAKKALKAVCCMLTAPTREFIPAFDETLLTAQLAAQIDSSFTKILNPSVDIPKPGSLESQAPTVTHLITRQVISELGENPDEGVAWPSTGQRWSTYVDISNSGFQNATKHFSDWNEENKYSPNAFLASINAVESLHYLGECYGGIGTVAYDFTAANKFTHSLAWADYAFPHYYNVAQHSPLNIITEESIKAADGSIRKPPFPEWRIPLGNVQARLQDPLFQQTLYFELVNIAKRLRPEEPPERQANIWLMDFRHRLTNIDHVWNHLNNLGRYLDGLESQGLEPDMKGLIVNSKDLFGFEFIYSPVISGMAGLELREEEIPK